RQVNQRLDSVEKSHFEMLAELRASLGQAPQPAPVVAAPSFNPAPAEPPPVFEVPKFETMAFQAPAEMPPASKFEPLADIKPEPEAPQETHKSVFDEPIFKAEPVKAEPLKPEPSDPLFVEEPVIDAPLEEGFAPKASAFSAEAPEQDAFASSGFA